MRRRRRGSESGRQAVVQLARSGFRDARVGAAGGRYRGAAAAYLLPFQSARGSAGPAETTHAQAPAQWGFGVPWRKSLATRRTGLVPAILPVRGLHRPALA